MKNVCVIAVVATLETIMKDRSIKVTTATRLIVVTGPGGQAEFIAYGEKSGQQLLPPSDGWKDHSVTVAIIDQSVILMAGYEVKL